MSFLIYGPDCPIMSGSGNPRIFPCRRHLEHLVIAGLDPFWRNAFGSRGFGTWQETQKRHPGSMTARWAKLHLLFWAATIFLFMVTAADAGGDNAARPSEFIFLVQIALLIAVGRGLGELMQRIGQPSVMGELLGGLLLGPSLFGWLWPQAQHAIFPPYRRTEGPDRRLAQFGILLLLLLTGMETDLQAGPEGRPCRGRRSRSPGSSCPSPAASRSASFCRRACCRIRKRAWSRRCFSAPRCRSRR